MGDAVLQAPPPPPGYFVGSLPPHQKETWNKQSAHKGRGTWFRAPGLDSETRSSDKFIVVLRVTAVISGVGSRCVIQVNGTAGWGGTRGETVRLGLFLFSL